MSAGHARLFTCGLTPAASLGLGQAAARVAIDVLARTWIDSGLAVSLVEHIHPCDSPPVENNVPRRRAGPSNPSTHSTSTPSAGGEVSPGECLDRLGVLRADHHTDTDTVAPFVVGAIQRLLHAGIAYRTPISGADRRGAAGDDIFFDVTSQPAFASLTGLSTGKQAAAIAIAEQPGGGPGRFMVRDQRDPLLWRAAREDDATCEDTAWADTGLGPGRPGPEIVCAVAAETSGGTAFDVLAGTRELMCSHHEIVAAIARALAGTSGANRTSGVTAPFTQTYLALGPIQHDGPSEPSEPAENISVGDLFDDGADPMAVRLAILSQHHHAPSVWSEDLFLAASQRLGRWRRALRAPGGPPAALCVAGIRDSVRSDLDTRTALIEVDTWVARVLWATHDGTIDHQIAAGEFLAGAPGELARAVDALLGVALEPRG